MNGTALARLEPIMKADGVLVVNQSLVPIKVSREDIGVIYIPATEVALELGDESVTNLVALGALVAVRSVVALNSVNVVMDNLLGKSPKLEINQKALNRGFALARNVRAESTVELR
jgi:2-oxoglutarate ferredoxin oxidoreductase subunit gamma